MKDRPILQHYKVNQQHHAVVEVSRLLRQEMQQPVSERAYLGGWGDHGLIAAETVAGTYAPCDKVMLSTLLTRREEKPTRLNRDLMRPKGEPCRVGVSLQCEIEQAAFRRIVQDAPERIPNRQRERRAGACAELWELDEKPESMTTGGVK
ncbi:hypothetical protein JW905_04200 [bacterium]|nr:hypothetical protein [candidate division CSSED10-310 bacterium]